MPAAASDHRSRRVAVVDLGTNSTRLLVADVDADGSIHEVERLLAITRLGEGVDHRRVLGSAPRARVVGVLRAYRQRALAHGSTTTLAVATSAVRDARNRDAFLAEVAAAGFEPRLLSGDEEAQATFAGVLSSRTGPAEGIAVVDVGGGSTEIVVGGPGGTVAWSGSFDLGCVRLTERFLGEDVIAPDTLAACQAAVDAELAAIPETAVAAARTAVGVAGTVTTLAALDLGLSEYDPERIHGHVVGRDAIAGWLDRLGRLPLAERRRVRGLEPARAPVICAGIVVLGGVLDRLRLDAVEASERDILHGAALLAAARAAA